MGLNVDDLTEFFDKTGHNLMIFADFDARRHVRKLANNFGVDFEAYVSFREIDMQTFRLIQICGFLALLLKRQ